jgi:ACR3 family arsenite efflux pump ArsB
MLWPALLDMELPVLRFIYQSPRVLLLSLLFNFILSPLLIFVLARFLLPGAPPGMLIGVQLFGLVPCGGMAPAYTGMLRGNVGLSVSIAATSLLLSIGVVPLWTNILIGRFVGVPFAFVARSFVITLLLPLLFAWLFRTAVIRIKGENVYSKLKPSLKRLSFYGLMLLGFAVFAMNGTQVLQSPLLMLRIIMISFLFLTSLLAGSLFLGRMAGLPKADIAALAISSVTKNNALSLTLALLLFGPQAALAIAVAGPMVQIPVMLGFQRWYSRTV